MDNKELELKIQKKIEECETSIKLCKKYVTEEIYSNDHLNKIQWIMNLRMFEHELAVLNELLKN